MNKTKLAGNFLWRFFERCGAQGVTFIVSIVLARLLDPDVYGTLALVTVFTTILQAFVEGGFGTALIQKKDADDLDFSSVFYFNMAMCLLLYAGMFFLAPAISAFYRRPELVPVIRVLSLTLVVSGLKNVQQAFVSRNMLFKRFFFATIGGTIGAAIVGIVMAYRGFGVWALVAQHLLNLTVDTLILWVTVKWRPKWMFSWTRLKQLLSYGWKLLASKLLDTGYQELRSLIIGRMYTSADLAYYNRGKQFPNLVTNNINDSIDSVLFPTMSQEQKNPENLRRMTSRSIKTSVYLMAPIMMGMAACGEPMIRIILTEKWLPAVFYLRVSCVIFMFLPIHSANLNAIKALGRSDLFLKLEIIKKLIGLALMLASMPFGVKAMALSGIVQCVCSQIVNTWPNKKLLNYSYPDQIRDILPSLFLAVGMSGIVYCVTFLGMNDYLTLAVQVVIGVILYSLGSMLFKIDSFQFILDMIRKMLGGRKEKSHA